MLHEKFVPLLLTTLVIFLELFRIFWSSKEMPKCETGMQTIFSQLKKNLQRFMLNSSSCCEINVCGIINRKKIVSYNLWRKFVSGKNFLWKIVLSMEIFNSPTVTPQEPTEDAISNKQGDTGYRLLELLAWNTEREMVGKKIALLTVSQLL